MFPVVFAVIESPASVLGSTHICRKFGAGAEDALGKQKRVDVLVGSEVDRRL
jgi:hypothetical protein